MFDGLDPRPRPAGHLRLLKLADRLDAMERKRFDITFWVSESAAGFALDPDWQPKCGTVCCAGGYAAMLPEFIAEGLTIAEADRHGDWTVRYGALTSFDAITAFFDVDLRTARKIFHWEGYGKSPSRITPHDVARTIRHIVARQFGSRIREHVASTVKVARVDA